MTVYSALSLGRLASMALNACCELSRDLTVWGSSVEQRLGPKLWENYAGPVPSPLRWSFWFGVAESNDIHVPDIAAIQLAYHENLLSVAVQARLHDDSLTGLYRIHRGAALIYADLKGILDL